MTSKRSIATSMPLGMVLAVPSVVSGHHSVSAEYDRDNEVTLKGVVSKIAFVNPHTAGYIDVTNEDGTVISWELGRREVLAEHPPEVQCPDVDRATQRFLVDASGYRFTFPLGVARETKSNGNDLHIQESRRAKRQTRRRSALGSSASRRSDSAETTVWHSSTLLLALEV